jgi:hypothetical protein
MRTNDRLLRLLSRRDIAGGWGAGAALPADRPNASIGDAKLFAMTFAAGFLFTAVFIA